MQITWYVRGGDVLIKIIEIIELCAIQNGMTKVMFCLVQMLIS